MSFYAWEEGTIVLPKKDWSAFRTTLLKAWNAHQRARYEASMAAYKALKAKKGGKLKRPKKAEFGFVPVTRSATLSLDLDVSVHFDNETHSVTWSVAENNHAPEMAKKLWFAQRLFRALDRVEWTAHTGGEIIGNDEYHRDNRERGGGHNYVVRTFGRGV